MVNKSNWVRERGYIQYRNNEGLKVYPPLPKKKVGALDFIVPKVKPAEPLDTLGWITLATRLSTLLGVVYLVLVKLGGS